jgi:hypothetical protein
MSIVLHEENFTALYFSEYGAKSLKWSIIGASTLDKHKPLTNHTLVAY